MKLPKTANISGKTYTVRGNPKTWGGTGRKGKQEIVVGTHRSQKPERIAENYIHEVIECVAVERRLRYEANDEELVFVMNHKQFDDLAADVATALRPVMKK